MTGPHLTPEREAEIREQAEVDGGWLASDGHWSVTVPNWGDVRLLLAALDAERAAHNLTRTALTDSTERLTDAAVVLRRSLRTVALSKELARQAQENQRVLGLAVAEADKP